MAEARDMRLKQARKALNDLFVDPEIVDPADKIDAFQVIWKDCSMYVAQLSDDYEEGVIVHDPAGEMEEPEDHPGVVGGDVHGGSDTEVSHYKERATGWDGDR